jgi:hypothetical protein
MSGTPVSYEFWCASPPDQLLLQHRVVLENYSNSLLAQFDSQLGIIADRYLEFFQERYINFHIIVV